VIAGVPTASRSIRAATAASSGAAGVECRHLARRRQFGEEHPRQVRRPLQPRPVRLAERQPRRRVEDEHRRHRPFPVTEPAGAAQHGAGQRQRDQRDGRHAHQQQQQVLEPEPTPVRLDPRLEEPQRRKVVLHGLAPHEQVEHDRHGDERRTAEQKRREKRQAHDSIVPAAAPIRTAAGGRSARPCPRRPGAAVRTGCVG
jgi:hypothetical protein